MSGIVYLIHAEKGLHCTGNRFTQHYIGYSSDMMMFHHRMAHHRSGEGARLVAAFNEAGIAWVPARIWEDGSRTFERYLKKRRNHPRLCPICAVERSTGGYATVWPDEHAPRATRTEIQIVKAGLRWYRTAQSNIAYLESLVCEPSP